MDDNLAYYRRRHAEELAASRASVKASVRAAHAELARLYDDRIATLEARARVLDINLVSAA
jgi:hypothetical protein